MPYIEAKPTKEIPQVTTTANTSTDPITLPTITEYKPVKPINLSNLIDRPQADPGGLPEPPKFFGGGGGGGGSFPEEASLEEDVTDEKLSNKKKYIIYGLVGVAILVAGILIFRKMRKRK